MAIFDRKLIWWRDVPIDVENGLLTYMSRAWNNDIFIISANDYEESRNQCAWERGTLENVHMIIGNSAIIEHNAIVEDLLNANNVHICSGVKGGQRKYLDRLNHLEGCSCILIMESPNLYGNIIKKTIKRMLYPIIYGNYQRKYRNLVKGLFAMGEHGVNYYQKIGWKNIFNFMYLPIIQKQQKYSQDNQEIKMLYIGRFDFEAKGVNILMNAIDELDSSVPWKLDLVGGYGLQKERIINWSNNIKNVNFIGTWKSSNVVERMAEYDLCIVPSLYDGWNLTPQQAINAGIGCIITNNAGSEELVTNSKAGIVIKSGDVLALRDAMKKAIENRELVERWKKRAREYADKISVDTVGEYFLDGLRYSLGEIEEKPVCPWGEKV